MGCDYYKYSAYIFTYKYKKTIKKKVVVFDEEHGYLDWISPEDIECYQYKDFNEYFDTVMKRLVNSTVYCYYDNGKWYVKQETILNIKQVIENPSDIYDKENKIICEKICDFDNIIEINFIQFPIEQGYTYEHFTKELELIPKKHGQFESIYRTIMHIFNNYYNCFGRNV